MIKNIAILGSTGSIGTQTLDCVRHLNKIGHRIGITGLAAGTNVELLAEQAEEFKVGAVCVKDEVFAEEFYKLSRRKNIDPVILFSDKGLKEIATLEETDQVFNSLVGFVGLMPTIEAIKHGKDIALANKETLVAAGEIVMTLADANNVEIVPVDSEHCAIFQCLMGNRREDLKRIILTASGGPFRGRTLNELLGITPEMALKHPNWNMGSKITIDSATLMNKGLEVIEAGRLFNLDAEEIDVVIHPQSIIHSMVEYVDSSIIAQMGMADMRVPIQFALTYPQRERNDYPKIDFQRLGSLTFEKPDLNVFTCLDIAYRAFKAGGSAPAAMNSANEVCVALFLENKIGFTDIGRIINTVTDKCDFMKNPSIDDIIRIDEDARKIAMEIYGGR